MSTGVPRPDEFTGNAPPPSDRSGSGMDSSPSGLFLLAGEAPDTSGLLFIRISRLCFGVALLVFGGQAIRYRGYVPDLGLVPYEAPAHWLWTWPAAILLLVAGLSILTGKYARPITFVLGFVFLLCGPLRFIHHFHELAHSVIYRAILFELLACGAGSWMLTNLLPSTGNGLDARIPSRAVARTLGRIGLWIFALADVIFGLVHFQLPGFIVPIIPGWIPFHRFFAGLTGAALVAAGLAFATRIWMRTAALLLSLMFFLWVMLVHGPRIAHALHSGDEWNSGFVCLSMGAIALLVAAIASRSSRQAS